MKLIPFNKPYLIGNELKYIQDAVNQGKISGNGNFTKKCQHFFETRYGMRKTLLTTSCTDALEMASILIDIKAGDEVILPSYTFVSTANAFVLRGAKLVFADSRMDHPGIDEDKIEQLITVNTKAIVVVHYAGVATDMDKIMLIANTHNLFVVEDAAQAVDSFYKNRPLGSIGHLGAFSFHETKNIISGEGGMLVINDEKFVERSEIIWEKGTNRSAFFRGEVNKYGWVDVGSSFLPADTIAAFLYGQLECLKEIQNTRIKHWQQYFSGLKNLQIENKIKLPVIPQFATNNGHMFFIICKSAEERSNLIEYLKNNQIQSVFHYLSLHKSDFYLRNNNLVDLPFSDYYTDHLLRLPLYFELKEEEIDFIIKTIIHFYNE